MIQAVLAIIVTLLLVVGVHEAGHAVVAAKYGVTIQRISIGFGRPLLFWKLKSGIQWVWALWPLGGYVQLLDTRVTPVKPKDYPNCFNKKSFKIRFYILIAGALANLLLTFLALMLFFMVGFRYLPPIVPEILPNSPAQMAGLEANSRIIEIAGQPIVSLREVMMAVLVHMGKKNLELIFEARDGTHKQIHLDLSEPPPSKPSSLMAYVGFKNIKKQKVAVSSAKPLMSAVKQSLSATWQLMVFYLLMMKQIVTAQVPFSWLLGPVAMVMVSIQSFGEGIASFLFYIANFSLAVGLVNLLPIPGLDGGAIVLAMVEKIRGKPLSLAMEILLYRLALIAFALFFVQLVMNDLK